MKLLTVDNIREIVSRVELSPLLKMLTDRLAYDFTRWSEFQKSPRHAIQVPNGMMELMPCADDRFYSFKFVNGHPENAKKGKLGIVAFGALAGIEDGYPVLLSEMTLLTALRTAAVAALGARLLARQDSSTLGLIGNGAQAEFQVMAISNELPIDCVRHYDLDLHAMMKLEKNLEPMINQVQPTGSVAEAVHGADMIVTATAARLKSSLLEADMVAPGVHIHALGGDAPGKTELDPDLLTRAKVVVEYLPQSQTEGEIQNIPEARVYAEIWELLGQTRPGRESDEEITLFDAVGFALEDFSVLTLFYELAEQFNIGTDIDLIANPADPKNLFACLTGAG